MSCSKQGRLCLSRCFKDTRVGSLPSSCYNCVWAEAGSVYSPAIRNRSFKPPVAKGKMSWNVQQPGRPWKCEIAFHLGGFGIRFWQGHAKRVCLSDPLKTSCWCRLLHRLTHTILLQSLAFAPLRFWTGTEKREFRTESQTRRDRTGIAGGSVPQQGRSVCVGWAEVLGTGGRGALN